MKKKKRGAPKGHRGRSRPIPSHVDEVIEIDPSGKCPDCRGRLEASGIWDSRYVEDIVPARRTCL